MADVTPLVPERPYRLGLIHDPKPPEVPDLGKFVTGTTAVPAPPAQVLLLKAEWPMADNDRLGDCTVAGALHVDQAGALITQEPWSYCGDAEVQSTYFSLTGGPDNGLQLPQVLRPWHAGDFLGCAKNGGYAYVHPRNTKQVKQSIWIFGNCYMAVDLPMPAQGQFRPDGSGVWELTHTSADYEIEGGHCIVGVAYGPEGVYMVTWGSTVLATWEWWFTYGTQAYAVVPPAFVEKGGDGRGFDLTALDYYLPTV